MQTRYRLQAPIRVILDRPDGYVLITLPAGALLLLFGMVYVDWEDRRYLVSPNDLALNAELVQSA